MVLLRCIARNNQDNHNGTGESLRNVGRTELSMKGRSISLHYRARAGIDLGPELTYSRLWKGVSATRNSNLACNVRWGTFQAESIHFHRAGNMPARTSISA